MKHDSPSRRHAVSLLEVILAFAIFMIAFAGISSLITIGHDQALDASQQTIGTRLAQSKLAEVEVGILPASSGGSGEFPEAPGWRWEIQILDMPATNVYEVQVRVWPEGSPRNEVTLTQFVLDPTTQGNAAAAQPPAGTPTTTGTGP